MRITILFSIICLSLISMNFKTLKNIFSDKKVKAEAPTEVVGAKGNLFDFTATSLEGKKVALKEYAGKKVIILNVASKCGFTPQYADWEQYFEKNKDKVVVLGFPANDFMGQEPGTEEDIAAFCKKNYGVSFPMFSKVSVIKGPEQHPLFKWLSTKELNGWNDKDPTWNFCKYVINEKGELTHFFGSKVTPADADFQKAMGI